MKKLKIIVLLLAIILMAGCGANGTEEITVAIRKEVTPVYEVDCESNVSHIKSKMVSHHYSQKVTYFDDSMYNQTKQFLAVQNFNEIAGLALLSEFDDKNLTISINITVSLKDVVDIENLDIIVGIMMMQGIDYSSATKTISNYKEYGYQVLQR